MTPIFNTEDVYALIMGDSLEEIISKQLKKEIEAKFTLPKLSNHPSTYSEIISISQSSKNINK